MHPMIPAHLYDHHRNHPNWAPGPTTGLDQDGPMEQSERFVPPVVRPGTMAALDQPTLVASPDVLLRPFVSDDAHWVGVAFEDPEIQRWHRYRVAGDAAVAWVGQWAATWQDESNAGWAIASRAGGAPLGRLGLRGVDLSDGYAEISYWVLPAARGQGVATSAVTAARRWCFEALGLQRIEIAHSVHNPASCRVAMRAGFVLEGTRRNGLLHADGWHDMHVHARLSTDA